MTSKLQYHQLISGYRWEWKARAKFQMFRAVVLAVFM